MEQPFTVTSAEADALITLARQQNLLLFGLPELVGAVLQIQRPGGVVEDHFNLTLGYGRRQVILRAGSIVPEPGPRFQVHGTKGSFVKYGLDSQEAMLRVGGRPGSPQWGQDPESQHGQITADVGALTVRGRVATLPGRYEAFYEGVARAILAGGPAPVDPGMARSTIRVFELAMQRHQTQRFLPFGG